MFGSGSFEGVENFFGALKLVALGAGSYHL